MQKSDVKELRKALKKEKLVIDWIYRLYVNSDNEVCFKDVVKYDSLDEEDQFRHIEILSKTLSGSIGKDGFAFETEQQDDFIILKDMEINNVVSAAEGIRETFLKHHAHNDPYYLTYTRIIYDIPAKSSDRNTLEDGDYTYSFLVCAICPAKLQTPSLGYDDGVVKELDRKWCIGKVSSGFIYPSFNDRSEDRNELYVYDKIPSENDFISEFFTLKEENASAEEQKKCFSEFLTQLNLSVEDISSISDSLVEEKSNHKDLPVTKEVITEKIAEIEEDHDKVNRLYDQLIGETKLSMDVLAEKKVVIKTDCATITATTKNAQLVKKEKINGREYLLVPADGLVYVNDVISR